jgi:hypothetical protein
MLVGYLCNLLFQKRMDFGEVMKNERKQERIKQKYGKEKVGGLYDHYCGKGTE